MDYVVEAGSSMSGPTLTVTDRDGRAWSVYLADSGIYRARPRSHFDNASAVDVDDLAMSAGPLVLARGRAEDRAAGAYAALIDTVDLVASDPETATVEQVGVVARFAHAIICGGGV